MTTEELPIGEVAFDPSIYPRAEWSQTTVNRYAEALEAEESLPAIVCEHGTNRLLDGKHRLEAHRQLKRTAIEVEHHVIPDGIPPKLYAASLSAKHGDRISGTELQDVARDVVRQNPDFSYATTAQLLGVTRQTVGRWCSEIAERRRSVRKVQALLLNRMGWSNRQVAQQLQVSHPTVVEDVRGDISDHLTEDVLREALIGLPAEAEIVAEQVREELMFASWSDEERGLLKSLRNGEAIVVSYREHHANLVAWAESADLLVRIDRRSPWGNPFEMPDDGDRETVIANYAEHYLPHKPSLLERLHELPGRALACWCAPESCHGDVLKARAEQ